MITPLDHALDQIAAAAHSLAVEGRQHQPALAQVLGSVDDQK